MGDNHEYTCISCFIQTDQFVAQADSHSKPTSSNDVRAPAGSDASVQMRSDVTGGSGASEGVTSEQRASVFDSIRKFELWQKEKAKLPIQMQPLPPKPQPSAHAHIPSQTGALHADDKKHTFEFIGFYCFFCVSVVQAPSSTPPSHRPVPLPRPTPSPQPQHPPVPAPRTNSIKTSQRPAPQPHLQQVLAPALQMSIDQFRSVAVLGRGHFGKVRPKT